MKLHRFFIKEIEQKDNELFISDPKIVHQIKNVLRLQVGDQILFLDGEGGLYHTRIKVLLKKKSIFVKEKFDLFKKSGEEINLYFSVLKKDKAEWVLQKCTELGVNNFFPIISERTEKNNLKEERAKIIIKEAAEQSEKIFLPMFHKIKKLEETISSLDKSETFYLDLNTKKINLDEIKKNKKINIFVGPEGGWGEKDKKIFEKFQIKSFSLGDFVLRAETASLAIASVLKIF